MNLPRSSFTYLGIEEGRQTFLVLAWSFQSTGLDRHMITIRALANLLDPRMSQITALLLILHATMHSFSAPMRSKLRSFEGVMSKLVKRRSSLMLFAMLVICVSVKT